MPYTAIDHFIARMRFRAAAAHVRANSTVCDLGCGLEMAFLRFAEKKIARGVGLDDQVENGHVGPWERIHGDLQARLPFADGEFDHVTMLAVLEHLKRPEGVLGEAFRILAAGGSLIITWPSALVDPILNVLHATHLISDEMESDEHQERIPVETLQNILENIGFHDFFHRRFELGLNHLLVAKR